MFLTLSAHGAVGAMLLLSQSPQIGSMFLTLYDYLYEKGFTPSFVAIPSNRVNVSYHFWELRREVEINAVSQSPQIGSMFLTYNQNFIELVEEVREVAIPSNRVNVSYIENKGKKIKALKVCRNPLKSGQCFLQHLFFLAYYRKLNTPFAGTSLFLCFLFPYLTYLFQ